MTATERPPYRTPSKRRVEPDAPADSGGSATCPSVYPPSATGPYSDGETTPGWSGPLRCVLSPHDHDLHLNSGISWRERGRTPSPLISADEVERIFDAWVEELVCHHGDRTVAAVLSSPAIQAMFTGDIGQTAEFDGVGDHGIECVCDECQEAT